MRRRIQLYLGGVAADLPDEALVLFNWATTDASNPTIVKNSFSQSFDLPRTPKNESIFGHSGRLDRLAGAGGTGADFNASRKLPFSLYADTGEILVSGYAKLDSVTDDALSVSLYGGLGDFLYGLSYDSAGEKRTLASLDYGEDLDFTINKNAVADAWARLGGDTTKPAKWDIINFAPCYNGIPGDFKADKALIDLGLLGVVPPVQMDGVDCDATKGGGYALLTLPNAMDEWMVHDLRSYLQRPVLSVRKLLDAIADPQNNGGWTVDISDLAGVSALDSWLTRPLLPSLGTYKQTEGDIVLTFDGTGSGQRVGRFTVADAPAGTEVTARMQFRPMFSIPGATQQTLYPKAASGLPTRIASQLLFIQPIAYDSGNTPVAYGQVTTLCGDDYVDAAATAASVGYTPEGGAGFKGTESDWTYNKVSSGIYKRFAPVYLEISGKNIHHIDIKQTAYVVVYLPGIGTIYSYTGTGTSAYSSLFTDLDDMTSHVSCNAASGADGSGTGTQMAADTLRSGALVTKEMLLSTGATPADYLLALCKTFGLMLLTDTAARKVTVLRRKSFYLDETIDLTERVDTSKGVEITPLSFDSKWYDFRLEGAGGRFEKQYEATEGVQYGIQRVDTGYDFDAETKDLLNGVVLKSCAAVQDRGAWWTYAYDSGAVRMWVGPVLNPGCVYTLWDTDGANHEAPAEAPTDAATAIPYNSSHPGYDVGTRAEFRDADGKALDGADVLLFYTGSATPDDFNLTDDLAVMDNLTGGPCWLVETNNVGLTIPEFSRYRIATDAVTESLDFGAPRQVDIPGLDYPDGVTVYDRGWNAYIGDRLSVHSKVMKCRVRLDGLQAGPELLRRFWWYRGTLWVLNKIGNCSLTTFDPAECEFVQVRDKDNYIDNQY